MDRKLDAAERVLSRIDQGFLRDLMRQLVRIPTVNPKFEQNPALNREAGLQAHLAGVMEKIGLTTERHEVFPGRPNLLGRGGSGNGGRNLVLNGHIDVVPTGDVKGWTVDPFGAEEKDGRLYGRGSMDMKAGVAAAVAAVKALCDSGVKLAGWVDIHSVVDEEAGGFGSIDAAKRWRKPDGVIVLEPTWGEILPAEGGLDWVRVIIKGRTGHSGWRYNEVYPQPHLPGRIVPAVNAIELGSRFLSALKDFERDRARRLWHPLLPPGVNSINPGVVVAGAGRGADGRPAILSNPAIIPDCFTVDIDYKFLPQEDPKEVRAEFARFVHHWAQTEGWLRDNPPEIQWELGGLHFPPVDTPVDHPLVQSLIGAREHLGLPAKIGGFIAVCDVAHYAGVGVPGVIHGPAGNGLHGADEYVEIDSVIATAKAIALAAIDWCGVRGQT